MQPKKAKEQIQKMLDEFIDGEEIHYAKFHGMSRDEFFG